MKCKDCGGERTEEKCNLCELFEAGTRQFVETERLNNPKFSTALGCHRKQVPEMREHLKKMGVPTRILANGRFEIVSRAHQKALNKVFHVHNNDGGYGD